MRNLLLTIAAILVVGMNMYAAERKFEVQSPDGTLKAEVLLGDFGKPGGVVSLDGGKITVACGEGALAVTAVIPEGKSKMSAADFIRGRKISKGDILE